MEFVTIVLSALIGILASAGVVIDRVAESTIRDRLYDAETLAVRVDNAPTYQLVQGRVDQVRIAGRGVFPLEGVRIDTLELETDAIALNPKALQDGDIRFDHPLNAGARLVLRQADVDAALRSPDVVNLLRDLSLSLASIGSSDGAAQYDFLNPHIEFLDNNRLRFQVVLRDRRSHDRLQLRLDSGIQVKAGTQIEFLNPRASLNGQLIPTELTQGFAEGLSRRLDLRQFEDEGMVVRLLQFEISDDGLAIAAIVHVEPTPTDSGN